MAFFHFVMNLLALVSAITFVFLNFRGTETQKVVFLSFRGRETRAGFTSHLFKALDEAGISTFMDEVGARKMRNIDSEIERAINESKISIILFSKDYATSTYCLDELVLIMERRGTASLHVLPLFYKVSTSEVREQTGRYGEAFAEHEKEYKEEIHKVEQWKAALRNVTDIVGKVYHDGWSEAEFIEEIVKIILNDQIYKDYGAKKDQKHNFWPYASHYQNLVIKCYSVYFCFVCFVFYMDYLGENQSITTAYAFVSSGEEYPKKFTSRLCAALGRSRIPIYRPRRRAIKWRSIWSRGSIWSYIQKAINVSKMSIVVLTKDYASSSLCLDELVLIMKRKSTDNEYIVIPIFKDVNGDEFQQQIGAYLNAFAERGIRVNQDEMDTWRAALEEAVQAANDRVVNSIVRFHPPDVEGIAEMIRRYRENQLN